MNGLSLDVHFALRLLRRSPLSSAIAILALGVGIGANTAIFSLMNAVLLRPLPGIARPDELVSFERWQAGQLLGDLGYPDYQDYAQRLGSFSGLVAEANTMLNFSSGSHLERVRGALVSGNYFAVLGVLPQTGRVIIQNDVAGGEPVAVLSYSFWKRAFGGSPTILGSRVVLNGHALTIAGVATREFRGASMQFQPEVYLPISLQPMAMPRMSAGTLQDRTSGWLRVFGRLKPEVSMPAAQADVNTVASQLSQQYPLSNHLRSVALVPGVGLWSDDRADLQRFLKTLSISVGLLLLLGCANVANLQLAKSVARHREIALRRALGASPGRLLRLLLLEAAILAGFASVLAVGLAETLAKFATSVPQPAYALRDAAVEFDTRVLGFALMLGCASALMVACVPAWRASRVDLLSPLKQGLPGAGQSKSRTRGVLIAAQIAVSIMLLSAAGAALRTIERGWAANPIAAPDRVLLCSLDLTLNGYGADSGRRFFNELEHRLRKLPGIDAASIATSVPPEETSSRLSIFYAGQEPPPEILRGREFELGLRVDYDAVGGDFFRTLGIPLMQGRDFGDSDHAHSPAVAIMNHRLAKRLWPNEEPLGQKIAIGSGRPPVTVVGIVADVASRSLFGHPPLHIYVPYSQAYEGRATLILRENVPHEQILKSVRATVAQLDPRLPLYAVQTMPDHIANTLWRQRIAAGLLSALGLFALGLAAIGLYGVIAQIVSQRTREIGIRMAMGAGGAEVCILVVRQAFTWVGCGLVVGVPLAGFAAWLMQQGVPGATLKDPLPIATAVVVLCAVSLFASYIPARRAARVDPASALRQS